MKLKSLFAATMVLGMACNAQAGVEECPAVSLSWMADGWFNFEYKDQGAARDKGFTCSSGKKGVVVTMGATGYTQYFVTDANYSKVTSEYYDYCGAVRDYCQ